jgi:acyl-CoA thioester hydrolase
MAVFHYAHRVVYSDCTVGDHIYYARYLDILEAARGEFFRHLGVGLREWQARDTIFPVVECHLRYKTPARYDDTLLIEIRAPLAAGVRLNLDCRVVNQAGGLVLEAETFHACTNVSGKPKRLPEPLRVALQPYLNRRDRESP